VGENDYVIEVHPGIDAVAAREWDALLEAQSRPTPFMRHAYLQALEASGSACAETGWQPLVAVLRDAGGAVAAAAACWLKNHSYGEYVFDWAWADAYRRYGLAYYPKLVIAVPFTPVPGSRLLARDAPARALLLRGIEALARQTECSSVHLLFGDEADFAAAAEGGWMLRHGVQFHWQNRPAPAVPYADFAEFLAGLQREKRKKIAQERRKVAEAGVVFEVKEGQEITADDWRFFHHCYSLTYAAHHSTPYLRPDFFLRMRATQPQSWLLFIAHRGGAAVACSLVAIDRERGAAWGRYWGATEFIPCLHFEACYYQPLQWCIAQGLQRFEGGAQGEHKMARGLLPVRTSSAHWVAEPRFAQAIGAHLDQEAEAITTYLDELDDRTPFRR